MIDWAQRRRRVLGIVLLGLAVLGLAAAGMVWGMYGSLLLAGMNHAYALLVLVGMVILALLASGAYLLRKMEGE